MIFEARVVKVSEEFTRVRYHQGPDGKWTSDAVSRGWFVLLEGSWEKLFWGMERPDVKVGDIMQVTMNVKPVA